MSLPAPSTLPNKIAVEDILAIASLHVPATGENPQGQIRDVEVIALAKAVAELFNVYNTSLISAARQL